MVTRKSYGQFCGLARALDRVGDRWTLLIVRELLLGPATFRQLLGRLPGMSPSLLTDRIAALSAAGLVDRSDAPVRSKRVEYSLSAGGRELEPAVLALIRFGTRWMVEGPGSDVVDAAWSPLALRALLDGDHHVGGIAHLDVSGVALTVHSSDGHRAVVPGHQGSASVTVAASLPTLLAVASGARRLPDTDAVVAGEIALASSLLGGSDDVSSTSFAAIL